MTNACASLATRNSQLDTDRTELRSVLFINRSFYPDIEATGQLLTELCESLAPQFSINVLCGHPLKAENSQLDTRNSPLASRLAKRIPHTRFSKSTFIGRLTNMLTFQLMATLSSIFIKRPDIVVTETDPPFLCLLGRILQLRGAKLVCYLQDIYPDVAVALGKINPGFVSRTLRSAFFGVYKKADAVVVLSRDMQQLLIDGGVSPEKIVVIPNWVDTDQIYPVKAPVAVNAFRVTHDLDDKFVVMYSGNMGMSQNLTQVLDIAEKLQSNDQAQNRTQDQMQRIVFAFVGDGVDRANLESVAASRQLNNVRFFDYQPKCDLAISLSAADLHIVILRPEIKQLLMPSKLYGVLASGTPALVLAAPDCELAETVSENELGIVVESSDTAGAIQSIIDLASASASDHETYQTRTRAYAEQNCTRKKSVTQFAQLLGSLSS